jgi:hypothetical protein
VPGSGLRDHPGYSNGKSLCDRPYLDGNDTLCSISPGDRKQGPRGPRIHCSVHAVSRGRHVCVHAFCGASDGQGIDRQCLDYCQAASDGRLAASGSRHGNSAGIACPCLRNSAFHQENNFTFHDCYGRSVCNRLWERNDGSPGEFRSRLTARLLPDCHHPCLLVWLWAAA